MRLSDFTILVVDDGAAATDTTGLWFERAGYHVVTAVNGPSALNLVESTQIDLLVADIGATQLDAISFLLGVKRRGIYKPSIGFLTSTSEVSNRDAYDMGVEALFSKPLVRAKVVAAAEQILAGRESRWSLPPRGPAGILLSATFGSLSSALASGQIAFGRGGFCVESNQPLPPGPVQLAIDFAADSLELSGRGVVRWSDAQERRLGVEISYLDPSARDWVVAQTTKNPTLSFIPRAATAAAHGQTGVYAGSPSHEFRNLLAVIIAYGDVCQELLKPEHPASYYVEQMRLCAERAGSLLRQSSAFPAVRETAASIQDRKTMSSSKEQ